MKSNDTWSPALIIILCIGLAVSVLLGASKVTKGTDMKTLADFERVREFLESQGIKPTIAMAGLDSGPWTDLVLLSREWQEKLEEEAERVKAEMEGLSEEEIGQRERDAAEEARLENERILYHSSGYEPRE